MMGFDPPKCLHVGLILNCYLSSDQEGHGSQKGYKCRGEVDSGYCKSRSDQ